MASMDWAHPAQMPYNLAYGVVAFTCTYLFAFLDDDHNRLKLQERLQDPEYREEYFARPNGSNVLDSTSDFESGSPLDDYTGELGVQQISRHLMESTVLPNTLSDPEIVTSRAFLDDLIPIDSALVDSFETQFDIHSFLIPAEDCKNECINRSPQLLAFVVSVVFLIGPASKLVRVIYIVVSLLLSLALAPSKMRAGVEKPIPPPVASFPPSPVKANIGIPLINPLQADEAYFVAASPDHGNKRESRHMDECEDDVSEKTEGGRDSESEVGGEIQVPFAWVAALDGVNCTTPSAKRHDAFTFLSVPAGLPTPPPSRSGSPLRIPAEGRTSGGTLSQFFEGLLDYQPIHSGGTSVHASETGDDREGFSSVDPLITVRDGAVSTTLMEYRRPFLSSTHCNQVFSSATPSRPISPPLSSCRSPPTTFLPLPTQGATKGTALNNFFNKLLAENRQEVPISHLCVPSPRPASSTSSHFKDSDDSLTESEYERLTKELDVPNHWQDIDEQHRYEGNTYEGNIKTMRMWLEGVEASLKHDKLVWRSEADREMVGFLRAAQRRARLSCPSLP